MIYSVVLVSAVQRSDFSYTYVCSVAQLRLTRCDPMDCGPPNSSVHGIFQARMLERVATLTPGDLADAGIETSSFVSPALAGGFLHTMPTGKPIYIPISILLQSLSPCRLLQSIV